MPDKEDFEELISTCKWSWTTYKGCNGYKVTGPNGHSIFFPAVGFDAPPYGVIDETKRVGVYIGAENTGSRLGEGKSRHVLYFDSQNAGAGVRNDDNLYTIRMVLK